MSMRIHQFLLSIILIHAGVLVAAGQSGTARKPQTPCPEAAFQKACTSYAELVKAGDVGVRLSDTRDVNLVCYRRDRDSFFVFSLSVPSRRASDRLSWDKWREVEGVKQTPDSGAKADGYGSVVEFTDGINDESRTMPMQQFEGKWVLPWSPVFRAQTINSEEVSDKAQLRVDDLQVLADMRYKNRRNKKNVEYELVIQRSTGRFAERYTEDRERDPFSEQTGRCVVPSLK
jgi:hypothetical protein